MINGKRVLALIPARGGSKGLLGKNIKLLEGKPLIAYTISAALESKLCDEVIVSTEDVRIAEISMEYGAQVPFRRPDNLASDVASTIDVVVHALNTLRNKGQVYDILVLLQPTSPLRTADDIIKSLNIFIENNCDGLTSVTEVQEHPAYMRNIEPDGTLKPLLTVPSNKRRQELPNYYKLNGAIYVNLIKTITADTIFNNNNLPYIMPFERSVDIDNEQEFVLAETLLKNIDGSPKT